MAYNLYQVQMAQAWKERCDKENAMQEKAQLENALARSGMDMAGSQPVLQGAQKNPIQLISCARAW
eukprot:CAMPEP_0114273758 /NCGR_PEP_ID=MMETSP0058-20121206/29316_1 /TAXON_ID=36894 /ORGANISM="Pyramimonas parkeae, CCMP726" /LENGTH=65 /DNA_ID=CAMNT_0001393331 /DNA_START=183 /DNA_END=377 /DNA_ORIENTATION=+